MKSEQQNGQKQSCYGMVIDLDRCNGCGACMVACAVENNVAPAERKQNTRTGNTWMLVSKVSNGKEFPLIDSAFIPMMCQQCGNDAPCVTVCPQNAVEIDPATGIVGQIPQRCLGCRYCMAACSYHARYFNWWDPQWPAGMEKTLNPDSAPRMRGVVEKCNFCHARLRAAKEKAAAEGKREINPDDYIPACAESCPTHAIVFGDLADETSEVSRLARAGYTFRFLARLGSEPKVYYHSERQWVRAMAERTLSRSQKEDVHG